MQDNEPDGEWYWFSELDLLGIHPKRKNGLNDRKEIKNLVKNAKQVMFRQYHSAYTE